MRFDARKGQLTVSFGAQLRDMQGRAASIILGAELKGNPADGVAKLSLGRIAQYDRAGQRCRATWRGSKPRATAG